MPTTPYTQTTTKAGGIRRIQEGIATLAECERIAAEWRAEGLRAGTTRDNATDTYCVTGRRGARKA